MHSLIFRVLILFGVTFVSGTTSHSQVSSATITFDNRSGEAALVKLVGPSNRTTEVPNGQTWTVNVTGGQYYILTRYGVSPDRYTYSKGDPFQVMQASNQRSAIIITLHKVANGNYGTHAISAEQFDKTTLPYSAAQIPSPAKLPAPAGPELLKTPTSPPSAKVGGTAGQLAAQPVQVLKPDKNLRVDGIPIFAPTFRLNDQTVVFSGGGDLRNKVIDFNNAGIQALAFTEVYSELGAIGNGDGKRYVAYFLLDGNDRCIFIDTDWVYFPGALQQVETGGRLRQSKYSFENMEKESVVLM
jgi:hypothetical protein